MLSQLIFVSVLVSALLAGSVVGQSTASETAWTNQSPRIMPEVPLTNALGTSIASGSIAARVITPSFLEHFRGGSCGVTGIGLTQLEATNNAEKSSCSSSSCRPAPIAFTSNCSKPAVPTSRTASPSWLYRNPDGPVR